MIETYDRNSTVHVFPYTRQYDGEEVIIGRAETGVYLAVPPGAIEILELLAAGKNVGEAGDIYREKHGELPDISDFLVVLDAKGIVRQANYSSQQSLGIAPLAGEPRETNLPEPRRYHLSNFPQRLAGRIFSPVPIAACCLVMLAGLCSLIRKPTLVPAAQDLYFADHRTLIWTLVMFGTYGSVVLHEFAHLIAARAIGINSRFGLGNRLYDLVAETDLTGLWSVPKRQRYLPLLAGCLLDLTIGAALILLLYADSQRWFELSSVALRVWRALLFTCVARIFWQTLVFVRTDLYYVLTTFLNCRNLLGDTEAFLRNQLAGMMPWIRKTDQSGIPAAERRIIPAYAVVWIVGRIAALYILFSITIPIASRYIENLGRALRSYSSSHEDFWDALLLVFYFMAPIGLGLSLWIRSIIASWFPNKGVRA